MCGLVYLLHLCKTRNTFQFNNITKLKPAAMSKITRLDDDEELDMDAGVGKLVNVKLFAAADYLNIEKCIVNAFFGIADIH